MVKKKIAFVNPGEKERHALVAALFRAGTQEERRLILVAYEKKLKSEVRYELIMKMIVPLVAEIMMDDILPGMLKKPSVLWVPKAVADKAAKAMDKAKEEK